MLKFALMLKTLSISNLAVVTKLTVEFGDGLNLLTGETGSGKSIIVDALGLLLGGRASAEIIRTGQQKAHVEGVFSAIGHRGLFEFVEQAGIETEGTELVIRREVTSSGRSRAFINDQLTNLSILRELRPFLVDIHGQNDQQSLLYPEFHIDLLDLYAGCEGERSQVTSCYRHWQELERELARLRQDEAARLRSLDILEFQTNEIERAALISGEDLRLQEERLILANAEKLTAISGQCYHLLYESESATLAQLATVARRLEELTSYDNRFMAHLEAVKGARYGLEDVAYFLRDYIDNVDFSLERLKEIDDRLVEIDRLKRKYGATIDEVLTVFQGMQEKLLRLRSCDIQEQELTASIRKAKAEYQQLAGQLSKRRKAAAPKLEAEVLAELQHLAMERTQFKVNFAPEKSLEAQANEKGLDTVEFLVSANVGEEMRPLAKIASGGEISRLMLALKSITAPTEYPRTIIFDEVDVGIGGRVSEAVGQRLKRLATTNQVLCVTHQAQVARFADVHHTVSKKVVGDRTEVKIERLDTKGRIEELARMIGGSEITALTRQHAQELLVK